MKNYVLFLFGLILSFNATAQEMDFSVRINTQKLQTVDPKVFETLETTVREYVNSTKWSQDIFEPTERIKGNIVLTIQEEFSPTTFKADLNISASRPVFNSEYSSPMFIHLDKEVTFFYEQYQPLIYSQNSYNDNLSAVLAYYIFIILGMDYDSFSPFGGEFYFQRAQDIVNSVPSAAAAANAGWRSIEGNRNRYWLIENILSPRARGWRQGMYDYHRQALDIMSDDPATARAIMLQALQNVGQVNRDYPNSMIVQVFSNAKALEIVEIFKVAARTDQDQVIRIMTKMDAANSSKYREIKNPKG